MKSIILSLLIVTGIAGVACDWITPGECLRVGAMFGPCGGITCGDGLLCMVTTQGEMCTPSIGMVNDMGDGTYPEECALQRGTFGIKCDAAWDLCIVPCAHDGHCIGGTVCAEDWEMCVYPNQPEDVKPLPGDTLGPCDGEACTAANDVCLLPSDVDGSICLPSDHVWQVPCNAQDTTCPNGQVCSLYEETCVWPSE